MNSGSFYAKTYMRKALRRFTVTPKEYFDGLAAKLTKETADDINAIFQFDLIGDSGGKWWIDLTEGKDPTVGDNENESAQVTITMEAAEFVEMISGDLNPQMAFMSGKLKVAGEMGLALKLQSILI